MNPETLHHFGLLDWPFSKEIPDDALWLPPSKAPLVEAVCDAVVAHQSVLLTGDAGAGKTCVLRAVRHRLTQPDLRLTYCHNATLGRRDFYRQLCVALNLNPKATAAAVFHAVSTHVEELGRDRIFPNLSARRGAPPAPGHAGPPAHPAQLRMGLASAPVARPGRPARARGPPHLASQPVALFAPRSSRAPRPPHT